MDNFSLPDVNFVKNLHANFLTISFGQKVTKPNCNKRQALQSIFVQKNARKMLMKLTAGDKTSDRPTR